MGFQQLVYFKFGFFDKGLEGRDFSFVRGRFYVYRQVVEEEVMVQYIFQFFFVFLLRGGFNRASGEDSWWTVFVVVQGLYYFYYSIEYRFGQIVGIYQYIVWLLLFLDSLLLLLSIIFLGDCSESFQFKDQYYKYFFYNMIILFEEGVLVKFYVFKVQIFIDQQED